MQFCFLFRMCWKMFQNQRLTHDFLLSWFYIERERRNVFLVNYMKNCIFILYAKYVRKRNCTPHTQISSYFLFHCNILYCQKEFYTLQSSRRINKHGPIQVDRNLSRLLFAAWNTFLKFISMHFSNSFHVSEPKSLRHFWSPTSVTLIGRQNSVQLI